MQREFIPDVKWAAEAEGTVTVAEVVKSCDIVTVPLDKRNMICILTWPKDTARNRPRGIRSFGWWRRSCYLQHNVIEAFF